MSSIEKTDSKKRLQLVPVSSLTAFAFSACFLPVTVFIGLLITESHYGLYDHPFTRNIPFPLTENNYVRKSPFSE